MKLQVPFIQLPLRFDAAALAAEVEALGEERWLPHPQGFPGNSMLPLIAVDGDPGNESFAGPMRPTPHLQHCPYLQQVLASFGATLGRTRLMRLSGHAEVKLHADQGYYWTERVRVHVPIITQPTVRFICGGAEVNMAAGECWIFDTWRLHKVINDHEHARIHLVADTVGGDRFWNQAAAGRGHGPHSPGDGWSPRLIAPAAAGPAPDALRYEAVNVPTVMTPWEIKAHLSFLLAEAVSHPQLPAVRRLTAHFFRQWQELWACYGDSPAGWPQFRVVLNTYLNAFQRQGDQIWLSNEVLLFSTLMVMVGRVAVVAEPAVTEPGLAGALADPGVLADRA